MSREEDKEGIVKKEHLSSGWKAFRQLLKPQEGTMPRQATVIFNEPKNLNVGLATATVTNERKSKPKKASTNEKLASDTVARSPDGRFKGKGKD